MDLRIGHLTFSSPRPASAPDRAACAVGGAELGAPSGDSGEILGLPASPPPDALREVERAAAHAEALWKTGRELHFELDEDSGRVIVQVRDLEGRVIRTILPSEALDVLSGK
jgi:flagellar protein FlaG